MKEQAGDRSLTMSKLLRLVVQANLNGTRLKAPHRSDASRQVIRQFTRVGNNLNQIARQVNTGKVQVRQAEMDAVIAQLSNVLSRF